MTSRRAASARAGAGPAQRPRPARGPSVEVRGPRGASASPGLRNGGRGVAALGGLTRSAQCPPRPLYPTAPLPWWMPAFPGPGWGVGPMPEQPLGPQPLPPPGSRSPVHAVADPGITDSCAMPRVPPSRRPPAARLRKLPPPRRLPKPPRPRPGLGSRAARSEAGITRDFSNFRSVPTHQAT